MLYNYSGPPFSSQTDFCNESWKCYCMYTESTLTSSVRAEKVIKLYITNKKVVPRKPAV